MSRNASITIDWADGTHTFRLPIAQIEELQEKTDCGPYFLFNRIVTGQWRIADLRETIRLGLIGGGMEPPKARTLVERYVDNRPYAESIKPAQAILGAALIGAPDGEKPGKAKRQRKLAENSQTENSPLPPSMEPPPPSDSPPAT